MNYKYIVLFENNYGVMQQELNSYGRYSCRDDAGKTDDFVSDIYLWPFQPVLKRLVSDTWYIDY